MSDCLASDTYPDAMPDGSERWDKYGMGSTRTHTLSIKSPPHGC